MTTDARLEKDVEGKTSAMPSFARCAPWYVLAFILPCAIVLLTFWLLRIYPFGDATVSTWDLKITYTYFYDWFRHCLQGDGNIFYAFGKSLGGNMFATFTCFCLSPFTWLSFFFTGNSAIDFVTLTMVLKFGFAGLTALHYIRQRFDLPIFMALCLSVCYSMMLFMTTQAVNPMWMEVVIVLPLVMLGIFRLVQSGKCVLLFVSLLACIAANFYNGYMVCLFTMLFYTFESFLARPGNPHGRGPVYVYLGRFCATFTLAVVASAVVLAPTAIGLLSGKGAVPGGLFTFEFRYDFIDVFRSFFLGIYEKEQLPQLYTGTLVLICTIWYFCNKDIPRRERTASGVLLVIMVVSTWFAPFDRIWLGLRDGNAFYCRFTFLISGLLVFYAARCLSTLPRNKGKGLVGASIAVFVATIVIFCDGCFPRLRYPLVGVMSCVCLCAGLLLWKRFNAKGSAIRHVLAVCLVGLVCFEALVSCHQVFAFRANDGNTAYSRYESYFSEGYDQLAELDAADGTDVNAYRADKTYGFLSDQYRIASNEGLVYGYSHVEQYDSTYDNAVQDFLCNMGYAMDNSCRTAYNDPILLVDSLLGIKYVASDACPPGFVDAGLAATQDGNIFYLNPSALPLGFGASGDILSELPMGANPFVYEDAVMDALAGRDTHCYVPVEVRQTKGEEGSYSWEFELPAGSIAYGYIEASSYIHEWQSSYRLGLYDDDVYLYQYMDNWSYGVFPISSSDVDATKTIRLEGGEPEGLDVGNLVVCVLDMDEFNSVIDDLKAQPFEIDTFEDGFVSGTYTADADGLLFTAIPYDAGWTIKVNGQKVQARVAQDTFIALDVSAGENVIEMSYLSPGVVPGLVVTLLALAAFGVFATVVSRRDAKARKIEGRM